MPTKVAHKDASGSTGLAAELPLRQREGAGLSSLMVRTSGNTAPFVQNSVSMSHLSEQLPRSAVGSGIPTIGPQFVQECAPVECLGAIIASICS